MRFLAVLALLAVLLPRVVCGEQLVVPCAEGQPGANGVSCNPTPAPITTAAGASEVSHVLKASPGSLIKLSFTELAGHAGFVMMLNATAVPSGGAAVSPLECVPVAANGSVSVPLSGGGFIYPEAFSTGIVVVASASGGNCATYTTSSQPSGFFSAEVQ